jgi:hypothetical protein
MKRRVVGEEHRTHAPTTESALDLIVTERYATFKLGQAQQLNS